MRFAISINMQRVSPTQSMSQVIDESLQLVTMAERGGFDIAWSAEHHGLELTIGPNPFLQMMQWVGATETIRMGPAVVVAPYWHPIRLAGEVGLFDHYSNARLELGLGRGAFQYEFNRMANGIPQQEGGSFLREMVPLLKALWAGDVEHNGKHWQFPRTTSLPKPLQQPHPPMWVAARGEDTYDFALKNGLDLMCTPLSKPDAEVEDLSRKYHEAIARYPNQRRPRFMVLRRCCVYEDANDWQMIAEHEYRYSRRFAGLFQTSGDVENGFPKPLPDEDSATKDERLKQIHSAMMFGTPQQVVARLKHYESLGFDYYCYGANFDLPHDMATRSLALFINEVIPHFQAPTTVEVASGE